MKQVARFWIIVLSFAVSFGTFGYLFLSVWQPDAYLITSGTTVRLVVTAIALVGIGVFTWAAVFVSGPEEQSELQ